PSPVTGMAVERGNVSPFPGTIVGIQGLVATMHRRGRAIPLCLTSNTDIQRGSAFISEQSLSKLASQAVQEKQTKQDSGPKIKELKIELQENTIRLKGKVHKLININFEIEGPMSTDGKVLVLNAKKIKALGIQVKDLLNAVGVYLSTLIHSDAEDGVAAKGDTLVFDPWKIAHIRGQLTSVQVASRGVTIVFGAATGSKISLKSCEGRSAMSTGGPSRWALVAGRLRSRPFPLC
ncbi:MAG TPA: hypothetical protein VGP65_06650, partial [Candidatus Angelobacter sp.]|nr:hypothetical protein [Candidatus Angelobacter sp.]